MRAYSKIPLAKLVKQSSSKPIVEISDIQIEKLKSYGEILLAVIALSGVLTVAVVMPGALGALRIFQKLQPRRRLNHQQKTCKVARTFYYLRKKGYIETIFEKNDWKIIITKKGNDRIRELKYETISIPKTKSWDGKFWQVAADIPTKYRSGADAFRLKIKKLGLFALQRTLWFYPFDPRKEIEFVSRFYGIEPFVTVMRIDKLDPADKKVVKEYFKEKNLI